MKVCDMCWEVSILPADILEQGNYNKEAKSRAGKLEDIILDIRNIAQR